MTSPGSGPEWGSGLPILLLVSVIGAVGFLIGRHLNPVPAHGA